MFTSILIPSLQRDDLVERCLNSLGRQTVPGEEYEAVIIENSIGEKIADVSLFKFRFKFRVRQVRLTSNRGTTGAINYGAAITSSKYILLLNNDVELDPTCLSVLTSVLEHNDRYGFAAGKLLSAAERHRLDGAGDAMLMGGGAYRLGHKDLDNGSFNRESPILAGCGAAMLVRRSLFEKLGGLDEVFFAYLDDVDLCLRAELAGCQGIYVPQAVGYHVGSATLGDRAHPQIVRWTTRNQIFLVLKNYPLPLLFRLLPRIVVYQLLWCMLSMKHGAFYPYLLGIRDSLFSLLPVLRKRRAVMRNKKISNTEFLDLLRQSEGQVYEWHMQQPEQDRSTLLRLYFRLCRQPTRSARK